MNYTELSQQVQEHLLAYFGSRKDEFIYHNLTHTQRVVQAATQIANHYQLNEKDFFIVRTAAWFHDAGYFEDYMQHEQKSADMAAAFLRPKGLEEGTVVTIMHCILATRMPQNAKNKLEEIVCDADLFHLGTDDFNSRNKLMRKETEAKKGVEISKDEWRMGTIRLLEQHHYYTDYCRLLLDDKKQANLDALKKKEKEKEEKTQVLPVATEQLPVATVDPEATVVPVIIPAENGRKKNKKDDKDKRPDRGIETMFRITSNNNQRLSDMADNKAHIMITVNSIILSAIISLLLRKLDDNANLAIPTYIILSVSVLTIIFSILATRPSLPTGRFTESDISEKRVNLLFFGNFYRMRLDEYAAGMTEVMNDRDFLYGTLVKDVYSQGVVLGRKYRLLRISYSIFMYGLIISVLAFVIATIFVEK